MHPRLSLTAEFLSRHIDELRPLLLTSQPHPTRLGVQTIRLTGGEPGQTVASGVAGFKWNPSGTLVFGANVRWNFTTAGLTAPLTPSLGARIRLLTRRRRQPAIQRTENANEA